MPIINGTDNGEDLQDTSGDDVIFAMGGNDFIYLSDGFDDVRGGSGLDTLVLAWLSSAGAVVNLGGPSINLTDGGYDGSFSVTGGLARSCTPRSSVFTSPPAPATTSSPLRTATTGSPAERAATRRMARGALTISTSAKASIRRMVERAWIFSDFDYSLSTTSVTGSLAANGNEGGFDGSFTDASGSRIVIFTSIENFAITTGSGNDNITLGAGLHQVHLGPGNDFLNLGSGRFSHITGGDGEDGFSANYAGSLTGVHIDVNTGTTTMIGFEYIGTLTGSDGGDSVVTGTAIRNETLHLGPGFDVATVFNGADIVNGGLDSDNLTVDYSSATIAVTSVTPVANAGEGGQWQCPRR